MGVLLSSLYRRLWAWPEFKVCLVGLDNAGKTTILFKLHCGEVVETHPTIGSNVEEVRYKNVLFQVWDLGGQETLRKSWSTYYESTHAIILAVDSTDRARVSLVQQCLADLLAHESLAHAVVLVYANKQDCADCMKAAELAQQLRLSEITSHQWHIQACCALTGQGLLEGIDWITSKVTSV